MLKNYEKACLEVGDGMSSVPVSDEVEAVLRELPAVVKGAKSRSQCMHGSTASAPLSVCRCEEAAVSSLSLSAE